MNLDTYLTPYIKTNSKFIEDIDVRAETIKLLGENIIDNLPDIEFGSDFLYKIRTKSMNDKSR